MRVGSGSNDRALPGWTLLLAFIAAGSEALLPREGGTLELPGVFGGWHNRASRSATRSLNSSITDT